jgi:hypothetical protein
VAFWRLKFEFREEGLLRSIVIKYAEISVCICTFSFGKNSENLKFGESKIVWGREISGRISVRGERL